MAYMSLVVHIWDESRVQNLSPDEGQGDLLLPPQDAKALGRAAWQKHHQRQFEDVH